MEKLKFNVLMNGVVSVALSIAMLVLTKQSPTIENFLFPTIEGFCIAMVLVYLFPWDRWCPPLAGKIGMPAMLLTLLATALTNVTCITFILNAQGNGISAETLGTWAKGLPIFYLTAIVVSIITAKLYLGRQEKSKQS